MSDSGFKPKVCIIVNHENTILLFRKELIEALARENYDVTVLLPFFCEKTKVEALGAKVISYDLSQHGTSIKQEIQSIRSIRKLLASIRPDIVLTYTIKPNLYGGAICRFRKIPYIATITGMGSGFERSSLVSDVLAQLIRFSLKRAKKVIFQNEPTRQFFTPKYIREEQSILVNGSGVDLNANPFEEYPDNSIPELLFAGRIMEEKGIRELVQSVLEINKEEQKLHLTFLGPVEKDCEELVASVTGNQSFSFEGMKTQSEVHEYTKTCDAVIIPSYHEGMCNSLLEAASSGRPVITTDIPGCRETFDENQSGIGCKPRNKDSLKEAIQRFINLDKEQRKQMGKNARRKMEREFDRTKIIQQYIDLIKS